MCAQVGKILQTKYLNRNKQSVSSSVCVCVKPEGEVRIKASEVLKVLRASGFLEKAPGLCLTGR